MEAIVQAREEGLTRYVGITSHGLQAPAVIMAALERFDLDSILFPVNVKLWADQEYRQAASELLETAAGRDLGVMAIKALAQRPWDGHAPRYNTWYEPFDQPDAVERALRFTLSQPVTAAISAGDSRLLPAILSVAERFKPMDEAEQAGVLATAEQYELIF